MSLYRKYRPQTFEDVVGQEHIAQTLRNALSVEPLRVAHAYLFCGPRGTGKTTSARLLAKCLNCAQGPTPTPCNQCDFCTRVRDNQATMDLVEIDAASNTGVDNVRENIIERVNVAPAQGRYRVYIIDEVHMLSVSSFNALLKTLEEPPAHVVFVLATTDAHKVPPTISSRCQRFDFRRVGPSDISKRLHYVADHEGIALEDGAARLISKTADGGLRDALTLLEQVSAFSGESISESDVRLVLGTVSGELLAGIVEAVAGRDAVGCLEAISRATEEGVSFGQLTRDLVNYGRDLLLQTVGFQDDATLTPDEKKLRAAQSQTMGRGRLMAFVESLRAAEKEMRQSTDQRLILELALVRAASEDGQMVVAVPGIAAKNGHAATPAPRAANNGTVANNGVPATVAPPTPVPNNNPGWNQPQRRPRPATEAPVAESAQSVAPPDSVSEPAPHEPVIAAAEPDHTLLEASSPAALIPPAALTEPPIENEAPFSAGPDAVADEAEAGEDVRSPKKKARRIHDLEEFVELWPKVLLRVRKKIGVTAVAYLHDARPIELNDRDAVLEFGKEFHHAKACEAAGRLPFEAVLNECLATPHILKFVLAAKKPAPAAPAPQPQATTDDDEDEDEGDIFEKAQAIFGAEIVARSSQG